MTALNCVRPEQKYDVFKFCLENFKSLSFNLTTHRRHHHQHYTKQQQLHVLGVQIVGLGAVIRWWRASWIVRRASFSFLNNFSPALCYLNPWNTQQATTAAEAAAALLMLSIENDFPFCKFKANIIFHTSLRAGCMYNCCNTEFM